MATILDNTDRNIIPRWRDLATTVQLGELSNPASQRSDKSALPFDLSAVTYDWESNRTLSFAGDLISAAVVSGQTKVAAEAAQFVLDSEDQSLSPALVSLAKRVLDRASPSVAELGGLKADTAIGTPQMISSHRKALTTSPRNGLMWVDLALLHAMQGSGAKAERSMTVALGLNPHSRFVLRSAARLFLHLGDPERAHLLLRKSPLAQVDPWVIAAEIATATAAKRVVFTIDRGMSILAAAKFADSDMTELAAAVATLQLHDGSVPKARKFVRLGLRQPNENSLAQVKWLSQSVSGIPIHGSVMDFHVQRSFEAALWEAHRAQLWSSATHSAICWLRDQPFSSRPAIIGAHISGALLEDYQTASQLAQMGLKANQHDVKLRLLSAFIEASSGNTENATEQLSYVKASVTDLDQITLTANRGLIAFRENRLDEGRALYAKALEYARAADNPSYIASALVYWAREEVRTKSTIADAILAGAREAVNRQGRDGDENSFVLERIEIRHGRALDSKTKHSE